MGRSTGNGKSNKNSSIYFDNKMIEEEETEKQLDDDRYDECAYVKGDDRFCASAFLILVLKCHQYYI